jgi:endonuclease III
MAARETTTMAQIDQQAAREELEQASQLRAKAEQLIEIADELHQQADSHEQDALDLIAPAHSPSSSRGGR